MTEEKKVPDTEQKVKSDSCECEQKCGSCTCETETAQEIGEKQILEQENADLKEKILRQAAELENLRKRHLKELDDVRKYSSSSFAKEMLSVQDNMTRALEALEKVEVEDEHLQGTLNGIKIVSSQLESIFKQSSIERINSLGEILNPELHQAMTQVESEEKSGTIIEVFQEGYTIHGRLLRPALVVVAK